MYVVPGNPIDRDWFGLMSPYGFNHALAYANADAKTCNVWFQSFAVAGAIACRGK
jgi:hypothetical protein